MRTTPACTNSRVCPLGDYTLKAQMPGFKTRTVKSIRLSKTEPIYFLIFLWMPHTWRVANRSSWTGLDFQPVQRSGV